MRTFNDKEMKEIKSLVEEINAEGIQTEQGSPEEKRSARDRMISAYVTHLPDKEESQGEMMVERIYMGIDSFYEALAQAEENPETWVEESLTRTVAGKTTAEACEAFYDMAREYAQAIKEIIPEYDVEEFMQRLERIYVPGQAADESCEEELKKALKELILHNSALMQKLTQSMIEYASESMGDTQGAEYEYEEDKERDLLAVTTMAAYIAAKEGKLDEVPSEVTLDELTIMVCAMYESSKTVQAAEEGSIAWKIARFTLEVIGIVAMTRLVIVAAEIGFKVIAIVFGSVMTSILSVIMVMSLGYWVIKYGFKFSDTLADGFMDNVVRDTADAFGEFVSFSFELLKSGIDKIREFFAWAREKALEYAERIRTRINARVQRKCQAEECMEEENTDKETKAANEEDREEELTLEVEEEAEEALAAEEDREEEPNLAAEEDREEELTLEVEEEAEKALAAEEDTEEMALEAEENTGKETEENMELYAERDYVTE